MFYFGTAGYTLGTYGVAYNAGESFAFTIMELADAVNVLFNSI